MRCDLMVLGLVLGIGSWIAAAPPSTWRLDESLEWAEDRVIFSKERDEVVTIDVAPDTDQRLAMVLHEGGGAATFTVRVGGQEAGQFVLRKDKTGDSLNVIVMVEDADGKRQADRNAGIALPYRPPQNGQIAWRNLEEHQVELPGPWFGREVAIRVIRRAGLVEVYLDGVLVLTQAAGEVEAVALGVALPDGDILKPVRMGEFKLADNFQPVDITFFTSSGAEFDELEVVDGTPFLRPDGGGSVDLRKANWAFSKDMPSNYFAAYDTGPMFLHDLRVPSFWAPAADYSALHLLVRKTPEAEGFSKTFSVRVGSMGIGGLGGRGQVLQHDYHAEIPDGDGEHVITVPFSEVIAQDLGDRYQINLNREIRAARRSPDPNRFEYRPIGLPPGVEILGATLEKAPIQMAVRANEAGGIFEGVKEAGFTVNLRNITHQDLNYSLVAVAEDSSGDEITQTLKGQIAGGEESDVPIAIEGPRWGHYAFQVTLEIEGSEWAMERHTSFALLPPDSRKHRAETPFGSWTFNGGHMTCDDPDILGSLLKKAGLRFGMSRFPEERVKWGVLPNNEPKGLTTKEKYEKWQADNPDALPVALLMHEDSISGDHVTRVPDIFTGREPYKLTEKEQERFQMLWDQQIQIAKLMRENYPDVHLRLGNGPLPTKEEFLRAGFPAELFDSLGNEAGSFGRLPESQPPDWVGNNASLWMDHQLANAYGYDKPVTQCYEIIYPSTNPGNLTPLDQAAYFVRHGLHSLAWGIEEIRFGVLDDVGNAYRFSNWGASGLVHAWPHLNPKPAYTAVATMTRELDGAEFENALPSPDRAVYAMKFSRPDGSIVYPMWTIRGMRDATFAVSGGDWMVTDWEGNSTALEPTDGRIRVELSSMPIFVRGKGELSAMDLGEPVYLEKPSESAHPVAKLDSMDDWEVQTGSDPILESHNPLTPRRPGNFEYEAVDGAIQVRAGEADGPEVLPMTGALIAKNPEEIPGVPTEIGLWVKGNSGWGRVIFELEDAKGQTWTSIGASQKGEISEWMLDWLPEEFAQSEDRAPQADWNTNDVFGHSSINFEGWRFVRFPLPGNYPGGNLPWPGNSQWRSSQDGVVQYPLKLKRLIFELPEHVLKLTEFSAVDEQAIQVKDLVVEYGTQGGIRTGVLESGQ